jgi:3-hydroxyisobutyrate dehydrogenase
MSVTPPTRVAFIGLGHMGGHMCRNLITAGFEVSAYDLDPAVLARAAADGARPARDVADCARQAEILMTVLEAIGNPQRIFHLGPAGCGYAVKLLLNLLWFIQAVATAEALTIGVKAGVDLSRLHTALVASPANSVFLEHDVLPLLERGDYDEGFVMKLVTKDLGLAVDLARDVGVPVELSSLVEQIHRRAGVAYGDSAGELSAIRLYEDLAGVQLRWHT